MRRDVGAEGGERLPSQKNTRDPCDTVDVIRSGGWQDRFIGGAGAETMAMPQRYDPIEAVKRRAAEKKAEEEKKKAEALVCAARCRLKRYPPINRNRRGRNGRTSCARSSAANRGFVRCSAGRLRCNKWRCHRETMLLRKSSGWMLCLSTPLSMATKPRPSASAKS